MVSLQRFYKEDASATELCLDEVGRGCLFGRVYVACVVLPKDVAAFDGGGRISRRSTTRRNRRMRSRKCKHCNKCHKSRKCRKRIVSKRRHYY